MIDFDVLVVGAGAAGASAAHALSALGLRVGIVDSCTECAPCFKAEKLEPDQIDLLQRMNLMQLLGGALSPLHEVFIYRATTVVERLRIDQFGMRYESFVNALRIALPPQVHQITDTVVGLTLSDEHQTLQLANHGVITARLVVMATGTNSRLRHSLGAKRREIAARHTLAFGFDMELASGQLPHDGVNFLPDRFSDRVGFLTLFPIPGGVRANLFAYQDPQSDWSREMRVNTNAVLERTFSGLRSVLGEFNVTGRVSGAAIELWTTASSPRPGLVLIGDSYQSVCPATGTGLSKVLTDVYVLSRMAAGWFSSLGMPACKIAPYYASTEKRESDIHSLEAAAYSKRLATDSSIRFKLTRLRHSASDTWRKVFAMMR